MAHPHFPGGALNLSPIYYPPVSVKWILTGLIVFAGAVANKISPEMRQKFSNPFGFFVTSLAALAMYQLGFPPAAFAILFFLLMVWSAEITAKNEGFLNGTPTVDWVQNSKRWFVERVLKERPAGIQEKGVLTLPVQSS
jgi:hypothetical protein